MARSGISPGTSGPVATAIQKSRKPEAGQLARCCAAILTAGFGLLASQHRQTSPGTSGPGATAIQKSRKPEAGQLARCCAAILTSGADANAPRDEREPVPFAERTPSERRKAQAKVRRGMRQ